MPKTITSESVAAGHPDKIADQIADALLDAVLGADPQARSAIEVITAPNHVTVFGELSTTADVSVDTIVRDTIRAIGYTDPAENFAADTVAITNLIVQQSPDIAQAVDRAGDDPEHLGAGDQGVVFGYATNETTQYLPKTVVLSHQLLQRLHDLRISQVLPYLRPDAKAAVTLTYGADGQERVAAVVLSTQHTTTVTLATLRADLLREVILPTLAAESVTDQTKFYINPSGRFILGGPAADSGLTGRKIIVDTYGSTAHHGGGAFSGKDATKVDRSGAYYARYAAKNLVAAGAAERLEIQVTYAIGIAQPVTIDIETFGTEKISHQRLAAIVAAVFDFRPGAIIQQLQLRQPLYGPTAVFGHFGRDGRFPWENCDQVPRIQRLMQQATVVE